MLLLFLLLLIKIDNRINIEYILNSLGNNNIGKLIEINNSNEEIN
jgi:hypothetical protein